MRKLLVVVFVVCGVLALHAPLYASGEVDGIMSPTPVEGDTNIAIELDAPMGAALEMLRWFHNDSQTPFAALSIHTQEDWKAAILSNPLFEHSQAGNVSQSWVEVAIDPPVDVLAPLVAVFSLPAFSEKEHSGFGGGPGLGYRHEPGGLSVYFGQGSGEWSRVSSSVSPAFEAIWTGGFQQSIFSGGLSQSSDENVNEQDSRKGHVNSLLEPLPNPANPRSEIRFALAQSATAQITIYNARGAVVWRHSTPELPSGNHSVVWEGLDRRGAEVSSGVYFVELKTADFQGRKRLSIVR